MRWATTLVARAGGAWAVRETLHWPGFYLPLAYVKKAICIPQDEAHFANRKALRFIGICWMASVVCHRSIGSVRILWLERSLWLIALLFTHTISIAPLTVNRLLLSQAGSTADGAHLICLVHLKKRLAPAVGSGHLTPWSCAIRA